MPSNDYIDAQDATGRLERDIRSGLIRNVEFSEDPSTPHLVNISIELRNGDHYTCSLPCDVANKYIKIFAKTAPTRRKRSAFGPLASFLPSRWTMLQIPIVTFLFCYIWPGLARYPRLSNYGSESDQTQQNPNDSQSILGVSLSPYKQEDLQYINSFIVEPQQQTIGINDIFGLDEAKKEILLEVYLFQEWVKKAISEPENALLEPCKASGILLDGAPGNGKTLLAKAIAKECNVPLIYINGSSFEEIYHGIGSSRIQALFEVARDIGPCIVFIDEIDTICLKRQNTHPDDTINQLLTELDGFNKNNNHRGVWVIGATNDWKGIDEAVKRSGRLEKRITLSPPTMAERLEVLKGLAKQARVPIDRRLDLKLIASLIAKNEHGAPSSYAHVKAYFNEAILSSIERNGCSLSERDFIEGYHNQIHGSHLANNDYNKPDREILSYSIAAELVAREMLLKKFDVKTAHASIKPRTKQEGGSITERDGEDGIQSTTLEYFKARIASLQAMPAIIDIAKLTQAIPIVSAERLYSQMLKTRILSLQLLGGNFDDADYVFGIDQGWIQGNHYDHRQTIRNWLIKVPEAHKKTVFNKTHQTIKREYARVHNILSANLCIVKKLARLLEQKEELYREEIEEFFRNNHLNTEVQKDLKKFTNSN